MAEGFGKGWQSKNWAYGLLTILLVYAFVRSIVAATGRVYWYDELLTQLVTAQGSWKGIMAALHGPLDAQPPLFYLIEHWASRMIGNQEIALRFPSAVGVVVTMLCVFVYARRRGGELVALLSTLFLLTTSVFQYYAEEARPYCLVLACVAFALVCYQRATSPRWVVLLGGSLALAQSFHYLAVLAVVPFGVAELTENWQARKVRWSVWAALVFGATPLLLFSDLLSLNRAYYGAHHYYAHYPFSAIPGMYGEIFGTGNAIGAAIGLTALAGVVATIVWKGVRDGRSSEEGKAAEGVLFASFIALPFVAFVFVKVTHSGMTSRYILSLVLGVGLGVAYSLTRAPLRTLLPFAVFVVTVAGVSELRFWRDVRSDRKWAREKGSMTAKFIAGVGHPNLPVVVPNGGILLWLARYAVPDDPGRLAYLVRDESGDRSDTVDKAFELIPRYLPIRVSRADEFLAKNSEFLVYTEGMEVGKDWVTSGQLQKGWVVNLVASDGFRELSLVRNERRGGTH